MIQANINNRWAQLSQGEKAELLGIYTRAGYNDLASIIANYNEFSSGGGIHIKPENRGKFTALKERTGHSASWFKEHGTPAQKKMAVFALNARKWNHADGGPLEKFGSYISGLFAPNYKTATFGEAFRAARENGDSQFKWNGNRYSTKLEPTVYVKDSALNIAGLSKGQLQAMQDTWDYMRSRNVSARNVAAVMGNMMQESSFNANAIQKNGDKAVGYFQMHGDRLKDYNEFLKENNYTDSPDRQIDYMIDVMRDKRKDQYMEGYNKSRSKVDSLKAIENPTREQLNSLEEAEKYHTKIYGKREKEGRLFPISDFANAFEDESISLEDMTNLFTDTIERAGKPEYQKRQNYAKQIYNYFYGVPTRESEVKKDGGKLQQYADFSGFF